MVGGDGLEPPTLSV